jgi:hypothetical protein
MHTSLGSESSRRARRRSTIRTPRCVYGRPHGARVIVVRPPAETGAPMSSWHHHLEALDERPQTWISKRDIPLGPSYPEAKADDRDLFATGAPASRLRRVAGYLPRAADAP